jgi:hypothetical protein
MRDEQMMNRPQPSCILDIWLLRIAQWVLQSSSIEWDLLYDVAPGVESDCL